ncbi:MAG TPA: L,D-transpeptidase [Pyrinomonadaceae bacterium]|nr:L,D-transpeptidase [Pyrinomonadaceae bacterium]
MVYRLLILSLAGLLAGCTVTPNNSNTASTTTAPSPAAAPSAAPVRESSAQVVTLPLLDALLTDEKFVEGLKSDVKLSDEEVESLKRVSNSEIARLREINAEDSDGDGTDARARATEQLNKALGEAKTRELVSFASDYWSKGDQSNGEDFEMLPGPNAVPTDTRVVVNIPAFRMDLFQDGSLVKSYQVGIGYPQFPLPQGLRKAQTVIFNPTWTPPDSPWVASIKNVTPGETVPAGDKDNPLGPIKIPIGSPSLIHGGKSPAKIGKFASHGCVGMTNTQIKDFAMLLSRASETDLSERTVASYLGDKERTQTVKLNETVPVELRYETIVLEDGKLHIYKDVYAQNTNTEENLRSVLDAHGARLEDLSEQQRAEIVAALKDVKKETVIELNGLKGYPAPVNLDKGNTDKTDKRRMKSDRR